MKKEKMVKVEIVVNGQHRLTRIFDVDNLNAVSDAIAENKEVFSGDEFKQLTDNYMESVKWRIRDGFIGVIWTRYFTEHFRLRIQTYRSGTTAR
ncbi:hypothetical protein 2050HW_00342 [Serratia phage vB_SmaM_ 2050HW]|uniref:Uncharacterized protein n=1 Tax=Serratia phage vB_SmaM_ 2050HW TaxID=2024252 RepID=A0A289YW09_9CAUD|nr:hypothetical protein HWB23_gp342 [Serratia phage vB_SmaM_ 2050HW]ATA65677.1 hypothetical protein 2050HW_00342 [Serratia phage vB_SmaM_ 2050HW]